MATTRLSPRWKVVAGMAVVVAVAGVIRWGEPPPPQRPAAAPPAPASATQPVGPGVAPIGADGHGAWRAGGPPAHSHDRSGAAAAAVDYVRGLGALVAMEEPAALAAQREMAAAGAAENLVARLQAELATLRRSWPTGSLTYRVAPLAVRVVEESPDAMAADVWYVGVVSGRNLAPYEEWVTESYRLVWEREAWRVAGHTSAPGPRPDPGRQSPDEPGVLEHRLAGLEALA